MKLILCLFVLMAIAYNVNACLEDADCLATECCAATPGAHYVCMAYLEEGEQCLFRFRTPTCGCKAGLRCNRKLGVPGEEPMHYCEKAL